ncbi:MAG: type II toxin-antitoxin system RelB/DinJ family antitoxin [Mycoplasmataceae bacterium]|jgi:addiction module RelB/DinJ family antitoxin|nr:type II toxin-antitoxin system RelB/DinJ family antitoxin [Mycoplasmataceae bacterium]
MNSVTINFKASAEDKKRLEIFAETIGISISSLLNSFIKKTIQEQRIPFNIGINEEQNLRNIRNKKFNRTMQELAKDAKELRKMFGYSDDDEFKAMEDAIRFRKTGKI